MGSHEGTEAGSGPLIATDADDPVEVVDGSARLVAGRCSACDALTFPPRARCSSCGGETVRELLPGHGRLWTWTTQGFEPKPPYIADEGEFEPYGVGYVEFPGLLRVEGRLTTAAGLEIGMEMNVVTVERGGKTTYGFAPVAR